VAGVGKGRVECVGSRNQAAQVGGCLGDKNAKNQAMWTQFSLTNGDGSCFCIGGMWLRWEKVGLSGWVAAIERRGWEVVLGTKIPKTELCGLGFR
jgi:hypothetical protein